jgi:hypothetical protein
MFVGSSLRNFAFTILAVAGLSFAASALAADGNPPASDLTQTRYVWATNLIVHAEPDSNAAQVAKLPYGAEVKIESTENPKNYQEVWYKVHKDEKLATTDAVLSGYWEKVHTAQGDGWAFDGYLSRYPAPTAKELKSFSSDSSDENAEALFAKRLFHVAAEYKWSGKDSKKSAAFRLMAKHEQLDKDSVTDEMNWRYIEFTNGMTYEFFSNTHEISSSSEELKKIPLSFNEAMLWSHLFGMSGSIGNGSKTAKLYSGKFEPGHYFELGPADDGNDGIGHADTIYCNGNTCDLGSAMAD